jgi:hypothetical protein
MSRIARFVAMLLTAAPCTLIVKPSRADTVVQVSLAGLIDKRCVTTLTNGMIVPWNLHTDGLATLQNAFVTAAVAKLKGAPVENALPDDGRFAANDRHPEVVLNFSNDAPASSPQTYQVQPTTDVSFSVPQATYSKLFLFFNGSHGGTTVTMNLLYTDTMETKMVKVPDYAAAIPANDPVIFNLAPNLSKWSLNTTVSEVGGHHITGVELAPIAGKTLKGITFQRSADGFLVLWGATGVATSPVDTSVDAGVADAIVPDGGPADLGGAPSDSPASADVVGPVGAGGQNGGGGGATGAGTGGGNGSGTLGSGSGTLGSGSGTLGSGSGTPGSVGVAASNTHSSGGCRLASATGGGAPDDRNLSMTLTTFALFLLRGLRRPGRREIARGGEGPSCATGARGD